MNQIKQGPPPVQPIFHTGTITSLDPLKAEVAGAEVSVTSLKPAEVGDKIGVLMGSGVCVAAQPIFPKPVIAASGSGLTLTTSEQDVPDCTYTVPVDGTYEVMGIFDVSIASTGIGAAVGACRRNSTTHGRVAIFNLGSSSGRGSVTQVWSFDCDAGDVLKLRGSKVSAGGSAAFSAGHTTMRVLRTA